ncbi:MAG TPA: Fe-S cluster assembly protein NifU [Thermodesulfobacteriota bacterium]|nr:Fe-S cluster assembly protein NifU [Deltaproteobacteria bacterium]HNR12196.1 Fe-S cluster assembly protein NifU [Thermodesulfobacteriota bacterium]HNU71277.1 Fe-S cluster assembly protein NifU [Thermodesulfobacteriota bacterium]HOC39549.1 Fe-S cluster assembly protein NifU [Thermodesulfobacteriota bacterium]
MWEYSEKLKDHFYNPRNVGFLENADGVGEAGSLACGDALKLMIKLDDQGRISEAKFQTFGCGSAIASASALTELIKGKTIEEAEKITNQDIADFLGGMPLEKMHCSVMGREALEAAIANYRGIDLDKKQEAGEIVCQCFGITDKEILRAVKENQLTTVEQVTNYTKAGGGCGTCHTKIEELIALAQGEQGQVPKEPQRKKLTTIQKIKQVEETLEREIRPALKADGGDIELIDVEGNTVIVALRGKCTACPSSGFTLEKYVEAKLKELVSGELVVVEEKS